MKHVSFFLFILLIAASCEKDDAQISKVQALKNGVEWEGSIIAKVSILDSRKLHVRMEAPLPKPYSESFSFHQIPKKTGFFTVLSHRKKTDPKEQETIISSYHMSVGGDAGVNDFELDESKTNYLEITRYDAQLGIVEGRFQLNYFITRRSTYDGDAPDVVQFTDGHFKVKIRD